MHSFETLDVPTGIRMEAALDFFENLRMTRILNRTWHDPHTLNLDLDYFMENYELSIRLILAHLELPLTPSEIDTIVEELNFYDVEKSAIYRYTQSNSFSNHINTQSDAEKESIQRTLAFDSELKEFYSPIFELMDAALIDKESSVGIKSAKKRINMKSKDHSLNGSKRLFRV
jgi:hypothetical protein